MRWEDWPEPQVYPLPKLNEWMNTPSFENDNPWDWLRLPTLYAHPPKFSEREVKSRDGTILPPQRIIEIRCFDKQDPIFQKQPCACHYPKPKLHDRETIRVRHRRMFNLPTWLIIERKRYKCVECGRTFSQVFDEVIDDLRSTSDLRDDVVKTSIKRTFTDAADLLSVDPSYVKRVFNDYAKSRLRDYRFNLPRVLGVDENHVLGKETFICTDLENRRILDMARGKSLNDIKPIFSKYNVEEMQKVKVFVQDMDKTYRSFAQTGPGERMVENVR